MWRDTVLSASTPKSPRWGPRVPESWTQDHGKEVQCAAALYMSVHGEKCSWRGEEKTAVSWCLLFCDRLDPAPKQEAALVLAYIQMWPVAMPADFLDGRKCRKGWHTGLFQPLPSFS